VFTPEAGVPVPAAVSVVTVLPPVVAPVVSVPVLLVLQAVPSSKAPATKGSVSLCIIFVVWMVQIIHIGYAIVQYVVIDELVTK
jgi:hypothetical protein